MSKCGKLLSTIADAVTRRREMTDATSTANGIFRDMVKASELIASCGMNCGVCRAYLRKNNPCPGCRAPNAGKPVTRIRCAVKTCKNLADGKHRFCHACDEFPCSRLNHLDQRYRRRYRTSLVENLIRIRKAGIKRFLLDEKVRWTCATCDGTICVHHSACVGCGTKLAAGG
jgi:hypothetical protein